MATSTVRSVSKKLNRQAAGGAHRRVLEKCHEVASEEYENAHATLREAEQILKRLERNVALVAQVAKRDSLCTKLAADDLDRLASDLKRAATQDFQDVKRSLFTKYRRLADFTITLFGRTMAGKSTIREAITKGSGRTIGNGAQRTTREIRDYQWEGLRIVDTPGIAAYLGEQDRERALSVVGESDLILFVSSSDSIQEAEIEGLAQVRGHNKPIVFVLNVKEDLTKVIRLKRFLASRSRLFSDENIGGHIRRLERIIRQKLALESHTIVPVHAQAAFLSTRPEFRSVADELRRASRLDALLKVVKAEVTTKGPVRRIQCITDCTAVHLNGLTRSISEQSTKIAERASLLESKVDQLHRWESRALRYCEEQIPAKLREQLQPLRNSISSFVDDNIERQEFGSRWVKKIESLGLDQWAKAVQQDLVDRTKAELQEFTRQMQVDAEFLALKIDSRPASFNPVDIKRTLQWVSTGSSALAGVAGVAAWIAGSNIWNPIGWTAGIIGIGAFITSRFCEDRESKLQKQKKKTADDLRRDVDRLEENMSSDLITWFREKVATLNIRAVIANTEALRRGAEAISEQLAAGAQQLGTIVDRVNLRLYSRSAAHLFPSFDQRCLVRVTRVPGVLGLAVVNGKVSTREFASSLGQALNEHIVVFSVQRHKAWLKSTSTAYGTIVGRSQMKAGEMWPVCPRSGVQGYSMERKYR